MQKLAEILDTPFSDFSRKNVVYVLKSNQRLKHYKKSFWGISNIYKLVETLDAWSSRKW